MTDIGAKLLLYAQQFEDQHAPQNITMAMREAAAEIERLRAALDEFVCDCEGEAICFGECMHKNARAALEGKQ